MENDWEQSHNIRRTEGPGIIGRFTRGVGDYLKAATGPGIDQLQLALSDIVKSDLPLEDSEYDKAQQRQIDEYLSSISQNRATSAPTQAGISTPLSVATSGLGMASGLIAGAATGGNIAAGSAVGGSIPAALMYKIGKYEALRQIRDELKSKYTLTEEDWNNVKRHVDEQASKAGAFESGGEFLSDALGYAIFKTPIGSLGKPLSSLIGEQAATKILGNTLTKIGAKSSATVLSELGGETATKMGQDAAMYEAEQKLPGTELAPEGYDPNTPVLSRAKTALADVGPATAIQTLAIGGARGSVNYLGNRIQDRAKKISDAETVDDAIDAFEDSVKPQPQPEARQEIPDLVLSPSGGLIQSRVPTFTLDEGGGVTGRDLPETPQMREKRLRVVPSRSPFPAGSREMYSRPTEPVEPQPDGRPESRQDISVTPSRSQFPAGSKNIDPTRYRRTDVVGRGKNIGPLPVDQTTGPIGAPKKPATAGVREESKQASETMNLRTAPQSSVDRGQGADEIRQGERWQERLFDVPGAETNEDAWRESIGVPNRQATPEGSQSAQTEPIASQSPKSAPQHDLTQTGAAQNDVISAPETITERREPDQQVQDDTTMANAMEAFENNLKSKGVAYWNDSTYSIQKDEDDSGYHVRIVKDGTKRHIYRDTDEGWSIQESRRKAIDDAFSDNKKPKTAKDLIDENGWIVINGEKFSPMHDLWVASQQNSVYGYGDDFFNKAPKLVSKEIAELQRNIREQNKLYNPKLRPEAIVKKAQTVKKRLDAIQSIADDIGAKFMTDEQKRSLDVAVAYAKGELSKAEKKEADEKEAVEQHKALKEDPDPRVRFGEEANTEISTRGTYGKDVKSPSIGYRYRDTINVKPTVAKALPLRSEKDTESDYVASNAWLIKKDALPRAMLDRYNTQLKKNPTPKIPKKTVEEVIKKAEGGSPAELKFWLESDGSESVNEAVFQNEDGEVAVFNADYIAYFQKHIKDFSIKFKNGDNPAQVISGNDVIGAIMPMKNDLMNGLDFGLLDSSTEQDTPVTDDATTKTEPTDKGVKMYSTRSAERTRKTITVEQVRRAVGEGLNVQQTDDGRFMISGQAAVRPLEVEIVDNIPIDAKAFEKAYGRKPTDEEKRRGASGVYLDGKIQISVHGDQFTIDHEFTHALIEAGVISYADARAILRSAGVDTRKVKRSNIRDYEEQIAAHIEDVRMDRAKPRTLAGRVIKKVLDFIDGLVNLVHRTARGVARDIESGKIFDRATPRKQQRLAPAYETVASQWYSQMENFLSKKLTNGTPKQIISNLTAWANKGEFKSDELEWSGVIPWLESKEGKVTKAEVLDWLKDNNVRLEEVVKAPETEGYGVKYEEHTIPGGENYKEVLLLLPDKTRMVPSEWYFRVEYSGENIEPRTVHATQPQIDAMKDRGFDINVLGPVMREDRSQNYTSSHWDEPNVLAHIRMSEREQGGERLLHIEEVQSDWGQAKRRGENVPDAPFLNTTDKWATLAMKRMVRYAAENGFDRIIWTAGAEQADRYDLSTQIDTIRASRNNDGTFRIDAKPVGENSFDTAVAGVATKEKLPDYVGKDLAQKIINQPGRTHDYEGLDLRVGASGMKGFYDKILPAVVNKFFGKKAWGSPKVGTMDLEDGPAVWTIPVTPEMKSKAMREGMPTFSVRERARQDTIGAIKATAKAYIDSKPRRGGVVDTLLSSPEWRGGVGKLVFDKRMAWNDHRQKLFHEADIRKSDPERSLTKDLEALKNVGIGFVGRMATNELYDIQNAKHVSPLYKEVSRVINDMDVNEIKWSKYDKTGLDTEVISIVSDYRAAMDKLWEYQYNAIGDIVKAYADKGEPMPELYKDPVTKQPVTLKDVYEKMGTLKGSYAPRIWDDGDFEVWSEDKDGQVYLNKKTTRGAAYRLAEKLEREGRKNVSFRESEKFSEELWKDIAIGPAAKLLEASAGKIDVDPDVAGEFYRSLLEEAATAFKERAFRKHRIARTMRGGKVVKGYIEDPLSRYVIYASRTAGGIAKSNAALEMFKALNGEYLKFDRKGDVWVRGDIERPMSKADRESKRKVAYLRVGGLDPKKADDRREYDMLYKYIKEQLKNPDATDRLISIGKSIISMKYLTSPKSALVNTTAIVTNAPAAIRQYATGGKAGFAEVGKALSKSGRDAIVVMRGGTLKDKDKQAFIDRIKAETIDRPQFMRDAMGAIRSAHGTAWSKVMSGAMLPFSITERWNRLTTLLAGYEMAKKHNKGLSDTALQEMAIDANKKAHGIYDRATLPMWALGSNPAAKIGQMGYTYQKFAHNWLQMMFDMGYRKKDIKGMLWLAASPIVLGGATGSIVMTAVMPFVSAALKAVGDDRDPEKLVHDTIRRVIGGGGEQIFRYGLFGAGGMDLSGSFGFSLSAPQSLKDLTGPFGGVYDDITKAAEYMRSGQLWRAAERAVMPNIVRNVSVAVRELDGAVTSNGRRVWDERGRPYVPNGYETVIKMFGARSARRALIQSKKWEQTREYDRFTNMRSVIYDMLKANIVRPNPKTRREIFKRISEYNQFLIEKGLAGKIPFITRQAVKRQYKAMQKPTKKDKSWQVQ